MKLTLQQRLVQQLSAHIESDQHLALIEPILECATTEETLLQLNLVRKLGNLLKSFTANASWEEEQLQSCLLALAQLHSQTPCRTPLQRSFTSAFQKVPSLFETAVLISLENILQEDIANGKTLLLHRKVTVDDIGRYLEKIMSLLENFKLGQKCLEKNSLLDCYLHDSRTSAGMAIFLVLKLIYNQDSLVMKVRDILFRNRFKNTDLLSEELPKVQSQAKYHRLRGGCFCNFFVRSIMGRGDNLNWKEVLRSDGKIIQNLLGRIWDNWDHPVEGVRHQMKQLFCSILDIHTTMLVSDIKEDTFLLQLTHSVLEQNWFRRGKYDILSSLLNYLPASKLLLLQPSLLSDVVQAMIDASITSHIWLEPIMSLLQSNDTNIKRVIIDVGRII
ncbi:uncharacterized protein TRIADDRAFT_57323 [Trichoplax adhaerens]|uniref:Uncharacterized protein n=1 Tax=Trichoplax adhaerens TaxID=10228 RepID=B3RZ46_TRIAD|nr:hypothetical protein TRIADDRAFT_57323 [Trichoplax adhaerens]EDV24140.1 hypothetical protein TRIADDRAFT_57323 [Trichoplax adhaerens]|eukprot:XP_002113666.1 hypothetical protein TRIADDRAFT_57323 [Trichoplax adhaerens]